MCVSVCFRVRASCPFFAHAYVKTSSVDLYQKPKTLQSVLDSLVLRLDESKKIDKSLKKKKISQLIWNSVSLVSNSGQKCSLFTLKNSHKIGFTVGCCFLFFFFF